MLGLNLAQAAIDRSAAPHTAQKRAHHEMGCIDCWSLACCESFSCTKKVFLPPRMGTLGKEGISRYCQIPLIVHRAQLLVD